MLANLADCEGEFGHRGQALRVGHQTKTFCLIRELDDFGRIWSSFEIELAGWIDMNILDLKLLPSIKFSLGMWA